MCYFLFKCKRILRLHIGRTALHVAIESHVPFTKGTTSLETVRLLLKYGADPTIKETKCGNNALHMAVSLDCDPILVKVSLQLFLFLIFFNYVDLCMQIRINTRPIATTGYLDF